MNWLRWGIGAFGITAVILTALELAFPYARWLNCGPSIPIIDKIIGPPGCAWDGRFLPFPLWQAVVFDFAGGMVSIVAAIIWDSV